MSINQNQYQNIIYRLTKIEAAIDFVQTRLTNNNLTDNLNPINPTNSIFSNTDPFSLNLNNQNTRTTTPQTVRRSNRNSTLRRENRNTPLRRSLTPDSIEISMLNPSTNILSSFFPNILNNEEPVIAPSHRVISNNTELEVFKVETNEEENNPEVCTICQENIEDNSIVRKIKKCGHVFHSSCLDKWLEDHLTCPSCRQDIRINE